MDGEPRPEDSDLKQDREKSERMWRWAGALSRGTAHISKGTPRDDSGSVAEYRDGESSWFTIVVCDGAGSRPQSRFGSRLASLTFQRIVRRYRKSGGRLEDLTEEACYHWIEEINDAIDKLAGVSSSSRDDFATTLTAAIVSETGATFIQIGDCACVVQLAGSEKWIVPIWPMKGEYANQTYFLTREPEPRLKFAYQPGAIARVVAFTDGLENLVLNSTLREPHYPFFDAIVLPLLGTGPMGRDRALSVQLLEYLDGPDICRKSDDDKTLVVAIRQAPDRSIKDCLGS